MQLNQPPILAKQQKGKEAVQELPPLWTIAKTDSRYKRLETRYKTKWRLARGAEACPIGASGPVRPRALTVVHWFPD